MIYKQQQNRLKTIEAENNDLVKSMFSAFTILAYNLRYIFYTTYLKVKKEGN